jgi:hypothetical protein
MSTEAFDTWADNYTEAVIEELGEYAGQAHLDMLDTEALHNLYADSHGQATIVDKYDGGEF